MIQTSPSELRDLVRSLADIGIEPGPDVHARAMNSLLQLSDIHLSEARIDQAAGLVSIAQAHANIAQRYRNAANLLRQSQVG